MKPGFHYKLVNGDFGDPSLFVRIPWESRALLFDAGDIGCLTASEIFRISDVFVTHMHMDHFIGFDELLRVALRRELPVNIYGPKNITACIAGKLKGYTWNLISEYPAVINVFEFSRNILHHSAFRAGNRFIREKLGSEKSDGTLLNDKAFTVKAAVFDHGIPCLGFSLEEKVHINIDKDLLLKKGLLVGKWLSDLKQAVREGKGKGDTIVLNGIECDIGELSDLAIMTKGEKMTYATDIAITPKNLLRLTRLAKEADIFFCEAYFLEKDRDRAVERMHLTARECGMIAKNAVVKRLEVIHISPKYSGCKEMVIEEAMAAFSGPR